MASLTDLPESGADDDWKVRYERLRRFADEHRRLPGRTEVCDGDYLGSWINTQRMAKRGKSRCRMTPEREAALNAIPGWTWEVNFDDIWFGKLVLLRQFVTEHKRLPMVNESFRGVAIGPWASTQRVRRRVGLPSDRAAALQSVPGWVWSHDRKLIAWRAKYKALRAFAKEHGRMPKRDEVHNGHKIGRWVDNQRQIRKGKKIGRLTPENIAALEKIAVWYW